MFNLKKLVESHSNKNILLIDPNGLHESEHSGVEYAHTSDEITIKSYAVLTKLRDPAPCEPPWLMLVEGINVGENTCADELASEINNHGGHERGYAVLWLERLDEEIPHENYSKTV